MSYLDSNIFIYPVIYDEATEPKVRKAKQILLSVENSKLSAFTSTLTWDEVVWVVSKVMGRAEAVSQGKKLLHFPNLQFVEANENVVARAQKILEKYSLSPRDAIHVASAMEKRTKVIISDDADFDRIKEIKRTPL
jgi:uncharacterized protein